MAAAPSATPVANSPASGQATPSSSDNSTPAVVPFVRGSGLGRYKFYSKSGLTFTSNTQDLGPIDVKAYDFMRSILITVTTTAAGTPGTGGTLAADGPFNALTNIMVKQPNGQTMYQVSSGYHSAMIHKWGGYAGYNDPRNFPGFAFVGTSTAAPTLTFAFRIPFELNIRDALGALPNKNAAAPFTLEMTLNTLTNVFTAGTGTSPTVTVEAWLEAWDQPPSTLGGAPVQTQPPNVNTLQRWTEQNITITPGQFDARVRKLGNYIREFIFILKNGSVRDIADWPNPMQIVLDEDVKDNLSLATWQNDLYERYGYGGLFETNTAGPGVVNSSAIIGNDAVGGLDTGVMPYSYAHEFVGQFGHENGDLYLPTIESEDYLLRGSYGASATKLVTLVDEVLPQGNIFQ